MSDRLEMKFKISKTETQPESLQTAKKENFETIVNG